MSDLALGPAIQCTGQGTVIEIPSDDSDDSDIDMDSEGDRELETADVDERTTKEFGADSNRSKSSDPPTTASAASADSTESQHPPITESFASQTSRNTYDPSSVTSGASSFGTSTNDPRDHPSDVSQVPVEDSSSGDEELRHILRAARKAKVQKASGKQFAPAPAPVVPSASVLSAGIKAVFGDQVERTRDFFNPDKKHSPNPHAGAVHGNKPPDGSHTTSKRKASYDPFAVNILNIEPEPEGDDRAKEKKTSRDKTKDRPRKSTSSQTPHANHHQHISRHASTNTASRDIDCHSLETRGFVEIPKASGASKRRRSIVSNVPSRPRATSVDRFDTTPRQRRVDFEPLLAPRSSESATARPASARHKPGRTGNQDNQSQRAIINDDEDEDEDEEEEADAAQAPLVNPFRAIPAIDRSGSGMLSPITHHQRRQATQNSVRNTSLDASQAQSNDLQGYIGGLPEARPAYARKQASKWDRALKTTKTRQGGFNRVGKSTMGDKHRSQQFRSPSRRDADARLLSAQVSSGWKQSQLPSTRTILQKGNARSNGHHSQHVDTTSTRPLFKPNKNAYHQLTLEDEENQSDRDNPAPPLYATALNGSQAQRTSNSLPRPSLRPHNHVTPSAYADDDGFFGLPRSSGNTNASRFPRQAQSPMRSIADVDSQRPQRPHVPPVTRNIPPPIRFREPQPQRKQVTREELDQAEAHMTALMKNHTEKRQAMIVDELPLGFGASEPLDVRRARETMTRKKAKINKDGELAAEVHLARKINARKREIWRETRKKFSDETPQFQEEEAQKRFASYLERKKKELAANRHEAYVPRARFDAAFLESGQNDEEAHEDQDDQGFNLKARRIPASEAIEVLGPHRSVDKYSVLLSEPHSDPNGASKFSGTMAFGQLESANYYASMILVDQTPPGTSSRQPKKKKKKKQELTHAILGKVNGLLWGRGMLSGGHGAGKWITVMVHKESQIIGDLDPNALRNRFVDEEILDKYARDAYDVVMINTVPKCFQEAEQEEKDKLAAPEQREEREQNQEQNSKKQTGLPAVEKDDVPTGLEGDELRQKLANLRPPGTSQANSDADDTEADHEQSVSDTASEASYNSHSSRGTLRPSSPAGDSYDRSPRNPFADLDHEYSALGTFTRLRDANETALGAAKCRWEPRIKTKYTDGIWTDKILPYLQDERQAMMNMEEQELHLVFPGFGSAGPHRDYRPWGFTQSQVKVIKRELEGPVDLAIEYYQDSHDAYQASATFDKAIERVEQDEAQAAAGTEAGGEGQGPEIIELQEDEPSDRESSDEDDYSEEE